MDLDRSVLMEAGRAHTSAEGRLGAIQHFGRTLNSSSPPARAIGPGSSLLPQAPGDFLEVSAPLHHAAVTGLAACLCASKASAGQECGCRPASKPLAAGLQDSECRPVGGTGQTWSPTPHLEHEQKGVLSLLLRQLAKPVRFNQSPTK